MSLQPASSPDTLPLAEQILGAIRAKVITGPNAQKLREIARVVNGANFTGLDISHLEMTLASALQFTRPHGEYQTWPTPIQAIYERASGMTASPVGLQARVLRDFAPKVKSFTIDHYLLAAKAYVQDAMTKLQMPIEEAEAIIKKTLDEAKLLHPELNMSYGYIGNIWHAPYRDDRSFKIFTTLATLDCRGACNIIFGSHSLSNLGAFAILVKNQLKPWAAQQAELLATGRLRQVKVS